MEVFDKNCQIVIFNECGYFNSKGENVYAFGKHNNLSKNLTNKWEMGQKMKKNQPQNVLQFTIQLCLILIHNHP